MPQTSTQAEPVRPGTRYYVGIGFFVLGLICPVFIPLVTATGLSKAWKTVISGFLSIGLPELLWIAAAAIMGKKGFQYMKGRLWAFFKRHGPPDTVSRTRYRIGLCMFVLPIVFGWLVPYGPDFVPGYAGYRFWFNLTGDVMFVSSLFVLGGDFWDKLAALFKYDSRAEKQ